MKIKTNDGIGEGMPLTDLQTYNIRLKENTRAIYLLGFIIFGIFIFLFAYVHKFNVLGNIIARCLP